MAHGDFVGSPTSKKAYVFPVPSSRGGRPPIRKRRSYFAVNACDRGHSDQRHEIECDQTGSDLRIRVERFARRLDTRSFDDHEGSPKLRVSIRLHDNAVAIQLFSDRDLVLDRGGKFLGRRGRGYVARGKDSHAGRPDYPPSVSYMMPSVLPPSSVVKSPASSAANVVTDVVTPPAWVIRRQAASSVRAATPPQASTAT